MESPPAEVDTYFKKRWQNNPRSLNCVHLANSGLESCLNHPEDQECIVFGDIVSCAVLALILGRTEIIPFLSLLFLAF